MSHIWSQEDRETLMEQHQRNLIAWGAQLRVSHDIVDDIEPYLSKAFPQGLQGTVKDVYSALGNLRDVLACLDYFTARMTELDMTPEQAREMWEKHQPDTFIETMQDWQSSGPNEINLVDEFILQPMGLPSCPEKQAPEASAPEYDSQDTEDPAP